MSRSTWPASEGPGTSEHNSTRVSVGGLGRQAAHETGKTIRGVLVLLAVLGGLTAIALGVGRGRPGWASAVGFATAVVGVSSIGGWLLGRLPTRTAAGRVAGPLAGSFARLALPLAALGWHAAKNPSPEEAPKTGVLVVFFLALLAATLILTMIEQWSDREKRVPD